jgi:hypothetical protein
LSTHEFSRKSRFFLKVAYDGEKTWGGMKLLGVWELRSPQVYVYIGELPGFVEG